jgi:hypothetical protein
MPEVSHVDRTSLGLPEGAFVDLVACIPAGVLLARMAVKGDPNPRCRIFWRLFGASRYAELGFPDGCNHFDTPLPSRSAAEIFVLGSTWDERGGDWTGLYRVALADAVPHYTPLLPRDQSLCIVRAEGMGAGGSQRRGNGMMSAGTWGGGGP